MDYNPNFLDYRSFLTDKEKNKLHSLAKQIKPDFLRNFRNIEEFGFDFVFNSSQLEGNTYNQYDTEALIKFGQTAGGKNFFDAVMILNLRDAFQFLNANLNNIELNNINKDFLKDLHFLISKNLVPQGNSGIVRQTSVKIGGTTYVPLSNPQNLENELNYLLSVSKKYEDPFEKALYLHNNLSYLQYFVDCNKRTARSVLTFVLMRENLFPCLFNLSNQTEYSKSLVKYYETGNYDDFKKYFIESYEKTIQDYFIKEDPIIERNIGEKIDKQFNYKQNFDKSKI